MHLSVCVRRSCVLRAAVLNYFNSFLACAIALIASLVLASIKAVRLVYVVNFSVSPSGVLIKREIIIFSAKGD